MTNIKTQEVDIDNFDDHLCDYNDGNLLKGIYGYGFERPSPIQAKTLIPICEGKDLIAQAQSGSGKTAAFVIGALTKINIKLRSPQAIIVANTRELAMQINMVVKNIGKYMKVDGIELGSVLCVGGSSYDTRTNIKDAMVNHILIGTPGRLVDIMERVRRTGNGMGNLKILVLDEADKLLGDELQEQMQKIFGSIPKDCQVCLFSATFTQEVLELTKKFLNNPVKILVQNEKISVDSIKNYFVDAEYEENKYDILSELYQNVSVCQAVIFVNSIKKAIFISEKLMRDGNSVGTIHSKLTDVERFEILKNFRKSQTRILVATDIISRGIDVQQVGLVINYDVPINPEQYIHRVGRSGRYGKLGVAITFITSQNTDLGRMKDIEKCYKINFEQLPQLDVVNGYLTGANGYSN